MTRPLIKEFTDIGFFQNLSDTNIAIFGALVMFLMPAGSKKQKGSTLLNWDWALKLPWGVLLLFGGGLSMAAAIEATGLSMWLGESLSALTVFHLFILIGALVALVVFLTELTSNTATTAALLPVLGAIAIASGMDPILLAAPAALAASCAFMLPVATGPNAIIFASGKVPIPQMSRAGFWVNIAAIIIITTMAYALVPLIFT
jgi:sodium-dependent dicarboxylate transporter 2/3/5